MELVYAVGKNAYYICCGMLELVDLSVYTQAQINEFMHGWNDSKKQSK
jgi:hypothetical protein